MDFLRKLKQPSGKNSREYTHNQAEWAPGTQTLRKSEKKSDYVYENIFHSVVLIFNSSYGAS